VDIKAYIASGILELYAMETLSPTESRAVEAMAEKYPEIQNEIRHIQEALNGYALQYAEVPRFELKREILEKVHNRSKITASSSFRQNWLSIAALLIAAISTVLAFTCYTHSKNLERQLDEVLSENQTLKRTSNNAIARLEFINNITTQIVTLTPPPPINNAVAPDAKVLVYWNPAENATLLAIKNLPRPPAGKRYQLWSIKGTNAPVPAGLIDFNNSDFQPMANVTTADAFAITLEDEDGSDTPTMPIYVVGNAI